MIWNILGFKDFGGQRLGAIVVTLYKFKLANGFAAVMESLITPRACSYPVDKLGCIELICIWGCTSGPE